MAHWSYSCGHSVLLRGLSEGHYLGRCRKQLSPSSRPQITHNSGMEGYSYFPDSENPGYKRRGEEKAYIKLAVLIHELKFADNKMCGKSADRIRTPIPFTYSTLWKKIPGYQPRLTGDVGHVASVAAGLRWGDDYQRQKIGALASE